MMMITGVFKNGKIIRRKTKAKKNMQFLLSLMYFPKTSFYKKIYFLKKIKWLSDKILVFVWHLTLAGAF